MPVRVVDKTTWSVEGGAAARFEYDIRCDLEGPYGLEIRSDHVFINPALLLLFSPNSREWPVHLNFAGAPAE